MLNNEQVDLVETAHPITINNDEDILQSESFATFPDGALIDVNPTCLLDLTINGKTGNTRRSTRQNEAELEASIKEHGIIQPLLARPLPTDPTRLELIAGYGRRDLAVKLKLGSVPILLRMVNDEDALRMHIDENDKRSAVGLVDEVMQAKEYVTIFKGDKAAAASRIGWGLKKLHERLALGNCTEKVLDALENNAIKPAHALILSNFEAHVQENTLQKCIDGSMSIEELKQRAGSVQKSLKDAKFDTTDCNGCKHNTGDQVGLFDLANNTDKCSNFKCFREKTVAHVSALAEKKFGHIILLSESQNDVINTTSVENVGETQFNDGCSICDNNVAVISDHISTIGQVKANQCTDKHCFETCKSALQAIKEQPQSGATKEVEKSDTLNDDTPIAVETTTADATNAISNATTKAKSDATVTDTPKAKKVVMPPKVVEHHKALMRKVAVNHLQDKVALQKAIQLASMIQTSGLSEEHSPTAKKLDIEFEYGFETMVAQFKNFEVDTLDALLTEASIYAMSERTDAMVNFTNIMINALNDEQDAKAIATDGWEANKTNLDIYTKQVLSIIGTQSGFAKSVDAANVDKKGVSFKQLENKGKPDFIKAMTNSDFDWSSYAPSYYLSLLK